MEKRENELKDLYKVYPILKEINERSNNILSGKVIFKDVGIDEFLNSGNESCIGIIFIVKGTINIQKVNEQGEETNLYNIKKGELCHEAFSCFISYEPLNILAKALENSKVCIVPIDISKKYLLDNPLFLNYIYKDLYGKFKGIINSKEEIIHESLENRLINVLKNKNQKTIYTTHSKLAYELGSAREVVSRKLKELEIKGCLKMQRGKINIINLDDYNQFD